MKIICKKTDLAKAVQTVAKAVPAKATTSILECLLLRAEKEEITLTGNNLFHTQIGVGNRLDGGRRRVKKYLWSFLRTAPAGAGQAVTCSTSGMGLRLK